jgi:hypothetical protein
MNIVDEYVKKKSQLICASREDAIIRGIKDGKKEVKCGDVCYDISNPQTLRLITKGYPGLKPYIEETWRMEAGL